MARRGTLRSWAWHRVICVYSFRTRDRLNCDPIFSLIQYTGRIFLNAMPVLGMSIRIASRLRLKIQRMEVLSHGLVSTDIYEGIQAERGSAPVFALKQVFSGMVSSVLTSCLSSGDNPSVVFRTHTQVLRSTQKLSRGWIGEGSGIRLLLGLGPQSHFD